MPLVKAFGLNRSELKTRLGLADPEVTLLRVPGIEATGVVAACPGGELAGGQQVVAMMGGMGRSFDGGCAEFTCVPVAQAIPQQRLAGLRVQPDGQRAVEVADRPAADPGSQRDPAGALGPRQCRARGDQQEPSPVWATFTSNAASMHSTTVASRRRERDERGASSGRATNNTRPGRLMAMRSTGRRRAVGAAARSAMWFAQAASGTYAP
jgi:hypothetical protein